MKKHVLAVLLSTISLASFATSAVTTAGDWAGTAPAIPQIYSDGLVRVQVANLFINERAAVSLYEAIQQAGEAYVQANGCQAISGQLTTYADNSGNGDATLVTAGNTIKFLVSRVASDPFRGDKYQVTATSGGIGGTPLSGILAKYRFNKNSTIMDGDFVVNVPNPSAPNAPDLFTGSVIKDFFLFPMTIDGIERNVVLDWGLQALTKKTYPIAKYWQRSRMIREDGIEGSVKMQKTRLAGGPACRVVVNSHGSGNSDYFYQFGTVSIGPVPVSVPIRALLQ
jgi:hypothetical protein